MNLEKFGLYLHIPFCRQKCAYCDFVSFANLESKMSPYAAALRAEIAAQGKYVRNNFPTAKAATIYIGGGTPTALPVSHLTGIIKAVFSSFNVADGAEITLEANPGTIDESYLSAVKEASVNRLSLGIQSFNDRILKNIGRIHTAKEALIAIEKAQSIGLKNISLDLMYGLPGQTLTDLKNSLKTALAIRPRLKHISLYGLTIEEGTPLATWQKRGKLSGDMALPAEDETDDMYDYLTEKLSQSGYQRYEISNYALNGFRSRHNLGYWHDVPYLGLGLAAHSYWPTMPSSDSATYGQKKKAAEDILADLLADFPAAGKDARNLRYGCRYAHTADIDEYLLGTEAVRIKALSRAESIEEFCFLSLRTTEGINKKDFFQKYGVNIDSIYGEKIAKLIRQDLLIEDREKIHPTEKGMRFGNIVWREFLL